MRHTFQSEQWLPYPVELVFAFFSNPENLPRLMPAWQKSRIEEATFAPPPPRPVSASLPRSGGIVAGVGTRMTITRRPFPFLPFRVPWDAEIVEFVWNEHFCDIQLRGPFAYWHHCHRLAAESRTVEAASVQGTLLRDEIEYEMPGGAFGEYVMRPVAERQLRSAFNFRHQRTAQLLPLMLGTSSQV